VTMIPAPAPFERTAKTQLKLLLALSRTPHGLLDMATPPLCALLWLGYFPQPTVILLGLLTSFAGYTAVYALNDLIDYRSDKEKIMRGGLLDGSDDLDAVIVRHPLAQNLLNIREAVIWTVAWALVALVGAYFLNPVCVLIFFGGCALEAVYCLLLRVSYLRTFISGAVKTSGGLAALFAVDPNPSLGFLVVLFGWLFCWEIGGQNIPNDWIDTEEDRHLQAETVPVRLGPDKAIALILIALVMTVVLNILLLRLAPAGFGLPSVLACGLSGLCLLLWPAYHLYREKSRSSALTLFSRASFYPVALLAIVTLKILFRH
jgi:4-hydroxybenzoate polyprenyltransferase